mmetsp:Transcript_8567/g.23136  ORF Transcript_8567/g.23136 Transcript_8567/m.23136 type:complete len:95 (-) Transcript_8567:364-648(-)
MASACRCSAWMHLQERKRLVYSICTLRVSNLGQVVSMHTNGWYGGGHSVSRDNSSIRKVKKRVGHGPLPTTDFDGNGRFREVGQHSDSPLWPTV